MILEKDGYKIRVSSFGDDEILLYHGGCFSNLEHLVNEGMYSPGHNQNDWSGEDFGGLMCSNKYDYAKQYGEDVIEIRVDKNVVEVIQDCPLSPSDSDWKEWMEDAFELLIPSGVKFKARFI